MDPQPAFVMGMLAGMLLLWFAQTWRRNTQAVRAAQAREAALGEQNDRLGDELTEVRQRLNVLEAIATDPAHRTAAQIDALR